MTTVVVITLMALGSALILLAGVGVVRMPDLFTRMHVATKSATLGVGLVMFGVAAYFGDLSVFTRALLVVLFFLLTAPIGAHLIGRAGYIVGVKHWEGTKWDELQGMYDLERNKLYSPESIAERKATAAKAAEERSGTDT
jgi:multicomponent Na+:H+ antiporter subunit G